MNRELISSILSEMDQIECRLKKIDLALNSKKPLVFLGPSLSSPLARLLLEAEYRPPVQRGDLLRAVQEGYQWIGIIDGIFHQELSVSIKEIRQAIRKGVKIYGASSMGALRAAEAYSLGMIGLGTIYQWYRQEIIDSDDEVALCFDHITGKALTQPLVNIRATIHRMIGHDLIEASTGDLILKEVMQLHFDQRTYKNISSLLYKKLPNRVVEKISDFFAKDTYDLKAEDAKILLSKMKLDYENNTRSV